MPADALDEPNDNPAASETTPTRRKYTYARGERRSTELAIAAALVLLEGIAALVAAVIWGYKSLTGEPLDETASLTGAVFVALAGMLLVRMAVALWQVDVWPRAPVLVIQLCLIPVSWSLAFTLGSTLIGVPLLVVAIALVALLFSRPVREDFGRDF